MANKTIVGRDYGAPNHEGVPNCYEPYVATAYSDLSVDFEKLPVMKGTREEALAIARKRHDEISAAEAASLRALETAVA